MASQSGSVRKMGGQIVQMNLHNYFPKIIQGGMGVGISGWELARAVSLSGQLGVVSGTALDQILARRLQLGDPGGHLRRAMSFFPDVEMVGRIEDAFYLQKGKHPGQKFKATPMFSFRMPTLLKELTVVAAFSEVFLAKEGHDRPVGINLLEKIQLPNLFAIYGAMLANVDCIFMGAGIPNEMPGIMDRLAQHRNVSLKIDVQGAAVAKKFRLTFNPRSFLKKNISPLKRPKFFPILSSATLARMMLKKASGAIDGFIVETSSAGGHNAPPRGKPTLNLEGEPVYGPRDEIDIERIKTIGLPFWLAGSWGTPEMLAKALSLGADGVQVGTAFAFCREAGLSQHLKDQVIEIIMKGKASVFTDAKASPTRFPFKVLGLKSTLSEPDEYNRRERICDLGYMRDLYITNAGRTGYRCPAEPISAYLRKGGQLDMVENKKCLCNALLSNIGLGQLRKDGYIENSLITAGKAILSIARLLNNRPSYSAKDVVDWLLGGMGPGTCSFGY